MARTQGSNAQTTAPRVRDAAERLFARHGYAAVSMRQIAAEVGVQAGALYNYTPDKQSLLLDLMLRHMDDLMAAWGQCRGQCQDQCQCQCQSQCQGQETGDAIAALEAFVRFHIRYNLARADAVFIAYMELRNLTAENFATVEARRRAYEAELEAILARGQDEGVFQIADRAIATRAVIAMLNGVLTWYRDSGPLSLAQVEDIYWGMVRKSLSP